jgi:glutamate N-acetyltransferase/amino-acid N-acetyltransferase
MAVGAHSTQFEVVPGVRLASVACGIKNENDADLVLMEFAPGSVTSGVFTQSVFAAAPVVLGKQHLATSQPRHFLINSGNANAGVGEVGLADAGQCCSAVSQTCGVRPEEVIPFSTGVIGERLPVEKITDRLVDLENQLDEGNWLDAARGIMTTDTREKITSRTFKVGDEQIVITGIAKGSGMIQPNMATMLCYVATNLSMSQEFLHETLVAGTNQSFNRITVDSDTSTNDSCMLTSTNRTSASVRDSDVAVEFITQFNSLMLELAHAIVRDGEGATKFIEVQVNGANHEQDASGIAYSIANSPLMKTALFASDANWGRIVMAIGKAGVGLDVNKLDVYLGDVQLMKFGQKHPEYSEEAGAAVMVEDEIVIRVELNTGSASTSVWTSDLSHEYVRINAEYRT